MGHKTYSTTEFARAAGCGEDAVRRWAREDLVVYYRDVYGRLKYPVEHADAFIKTRGKGKKKNETHKRTNRA